MVAANEERLEDRQQDREYKRISELLRGCSLEITQHFFQAILCDPTLPAFGSAKEQLDFIPGVLRGLADMLESPEPDKTKPSVIQAAASLGRKRFRQGYSAPLIVTTVRLLQRAIYEVARENLSSLERSILPLDLKRLSSSLAMQLEAALEGFLNEYVA